MCEGTQELAREAAEVSDFFVTLGSDTALGLGKLREREDILSLTSGGSGWNFLTEKNLSGYKVFTSE